MEKINNFKNYIKKNYIKMLYSFVYCFLYVGLGVIIICLAWSTIRFQFYTKASNTEIGLLFTLRGLGIAFGNIIIGYLLDILTNKYLKKFHINLNLIIKTMLFSITLILIFIPFIDNFWLLLIVHGIMGVFCGMLDVNSFVNQGDRKRSGYKGNKKNNTDMGRRSWTIHESITFLFCVW
jgi:MFS family permease